ncbi:MAG TPA: J domain-containing protein [Kofleriaceae bacterium]|nr:J domain-containing protein [Kofleriaceae bacterium]
MSSANAAGSGRVVMEAGVAESRSARMAAAAVDGRGESKVVAVPLDVSLPDPSPQELSILAADLDASESERRTVLAMARRIGADPWTILGVAKGTELSELKKVYFRLSKEIHPDRYYGKRLGPLAEVLSSVFESVRRAYSQLTEAKKQRERAPASASSPQAPAEYAVELFERGCAAEVSGDLAGALQLFAASVRVDPQLRVFRRGASCALNAKEPKVALEYAKKAQAIAPDDPSCARLLARAYRASEELQLAEEVLVFALALPIDNDVLMAELRSDLAMVRKLLTQA